MCGNVWVSEKISTGVSRFHPASILGSWLNHVPLEIPRDWEDVERFLRGPSSTTRLMEIDQDTKDEGLFAWEAERYGKNRLYEDKRRGLVYYGTSLPMLIPPTVDVYLRPYELVSAVPREQKMILTAAPQGLDKYMADPVRHHLDMEVAVGQIDWIGTIQANTTEHRGRKVVSYWALNPLEELSQTVVFKSGNLVVNRGLLKDQLSPWIADAHTRGIDVSIDQHGREETQTFRRITLIGTPPRIISTLRYWDSVLAEYGREHPEHMPYVPDHRRVASPLSYPYLGDRAYNPSKFLDLLPPTCFMEICAGEYHPWRRCPYRVKEPADPERALARGRSLKLTDARKLITGRSDIVSRLREEDPLFEVAHRPTLKGVEEYPAKAAKFLELNGFEDFRELYALPDVQTRPLIRVLDEEEDRGAVVPINRPGPSTACVTIEEIPIERPERGVRGGQRAIRFGEAAAWYPNPFYAPNVPPPTPFINPQEEPRAIEYVNPPSPRDFQRRVRVSEEETGESRALVLYTGGPVKKRRQNSDPGN